MIDKSHFCVDLWKMSSNWKDPNWKFKSHKTCKHCALTRNATCVWSLISLFFDLSLWSSHTYFESLFNSESNGNQIIFLRSLWGAQQFIEEKYPLLRKQYLLCFHLYRAFARTTAMQSCAVMQHAGDRMSTMMCQRMSSLDNTILLKYRIDIT